RLLSLGLSRARAAGPTELARGTWGQGDAGRAGRARSIERARPARGSAVVGGAHTPLLEGGVGGGQPGHRHAEGGTGHVVEPGVVAEHHRRRVSPVLAADADLEVGAGPAPLLHSDLD